MQYFVIAPDGTAYGPADMLTLRQWVTEGRIRPDTNLRDGSTGQTVMASNLPGLFPTSGFGQSPYSQPQMPAYMQQQSSNYGNYPPGYPADMGSGENQAAWILGGIGAVLGVCCSPLVGLICGIVAYVLATKAANKGSRNSNGPKILAAVAIILSFGMLVLGAMARTAIGM